jgi:hypothetical protein
LNNKIILGSKTNLGAFVQNRLQTISTSPRINNVTKRIALPNEAGFVTDTKGKILTFTGNDGFLLDPAGTLTYYGNTKIDDPKNQQTIDLNNLYSRVTLGLGSAALGKNESERNKLLSTWFNDPVNGLGDSVYRKAIGAVLGMGATKVDYWQKSFTSNLDYGVSKLPKIPQEPIVYSTSIKQQEPFQPKGQLAKFTPAEKKRMAALLKPGVTISARK